MSYDMTAYAELQLKKMRRRAVWKKIMCVLGCMVVFCTVYALILPAITMTDTPYCGIEEHVHGESCYKQELVCTMDIEVDMEEPEVPLAELPAEAETPAETVLVEVVAESEVPAEPEVPAEAAPEVPAPAHVHGEGCYEAVLTCPETEHGHEKQCFSNPAEDVETAEVWEQSLPSSLSGIWREDMVAVAKSQLGYRESTENYRVQEDGSVKGYTRYGAWYGAPYGDWCAMYLAFCLDYAGVENMPLEASCPAWISKLSAEDCGLYHDTASGYVPQAGDLVFFDTDYNGTAQHAGLVAEVTLGADGTPETIVSIEGNTASNCVEYMQYEGSSPIIMGYGELRQPEEQLLKNTLTYENSEMTVTAVFPAGFTLPENAVLQVQELTEDMDDYQAMADSVREAIVSGENGDLKTLKLYTWYLECEGETLQLPEDLNVDITVEYNEPLYTEEEQALAEVLTVITLEQPPMQTYALRKTSIDEEGAEEAAGYVVDVPESTVTNVEDGVTGFNLKGVVIKPTFGVAAAIEQKQGSVWYRVDQLSDLAKDDTVMIVSAEGNTALTYQGTDSGLA
ncbi:MAG: CHAP domain-containing protein, partial [Firmicutes bacterium]|nr:CHAP domain-containing protein [Bacillota bacterium]